jgi:hypothetical protein
VQLQDIERLLPQGIPQLSSHKISPIAVKVYNIKRKNLPDTQAEWNETAG